MNHKKELAKKNHLSPGLFWHTKQFCHFFTPVDQLFAVSCIKIDLLCTMSTLLQRTLWHLCVCWLKARGAVSTLFSFLKHGHNWCVCNSEWTLACVNLCVTSQLSRATLILPIFATFGPSSFGFSKACRKWKKCAIFLRMRSSGHLKNVEKRHPTS